MISSGDSQKMSDFTPNLLGSTKNFTEIAHVVYANQLQEVHNYHI